MIFIDGDTKKKQQRALHKLVKLQYEIYVGFK